MYPTALGTKYCIQQTVTGTGTFNGTEYGRARVTMDSGTGANGICYFASKLYGSASNSLTVEFVDAGAGIAIAATTVAQVGTAVRVILRRSTVAILATAQEVVDAVNAQSSSFLLKARAGGDGSALVTALPATPLTGGADSTKDGTQFLWNLPLNDNGGFFHFEQDYPVWILGFYAKLNVLYTGPLTLDVRRVRINSDFTPTSDSFPLITYPCMTPTNQEISYTDMKQLVHPGQAVQVSISLGTTGSVALDVMRAAEFPYA